ncbi:Type 1 glutamine amidotransferase-like domain-containing protein [Candidatus Saccharibacteria bacterium]|nr:MAG: Type 1 glutamine amidotransferase-like domain-containing protein [Candidatus Saccharibacteria bacterium]
MIVPTACSTEKSYNGKVSKVLTFFTNLGLTARVLHEHTETPTREKIEDMLGEAALVYTIGGNTPYMLEQMKASGLDTALAEAIRGGKVHAGTSAGALLPFALIHTNPSKNPRNQLWDFTFENGLGLMDAVATAHADGRDMTPKGPRPDTRREHLQLNFPTGLAHGLAIDNGVAVTLSVHPRVIINDPHSQAGVYLLNRHPDGQVTSTRVEDPSQLSQIPMRG